MTDFKPDLKRACSYKLDLTLWPPEFVRGCAQVAVRHKLNIDSVILAFLLGTSVFVGKSEISLDGSDRKEVGSIWLCNIQVNTTKKYVCQEWFLVA